YTLSLHDALPIYSLVDLDREKFVPEIHNHVGFGQFDLAGHLDFGLPLDDWTIGHCLFDWFETYGAAHPDNGNIAIDGTHKLTVTAIIGKASTQFRNFCCSDHNLRTDGEVGTNIDAVIHPVVVKPDLRIDRCPRNGQTASAT